MGFGHQDLRSYLKSVLTHGNEPVPVAFLQCLKTGITSANTVDNVHFGKKRFERWVLVVPPHITNMFLLKYYE